MSSLSSFVDTTVVSGSTPSLQYPTSESSASSSQGALVEDQLAASSHGLSSDSINSSLLHAAQAYLEALDDELHFHTLVGALTPLSSHAPSLKIQFKQLDHTTSTTTNTSSLSTPAPSFLCHLPNQLIGNLVNVALQVEDWRRNIPREWYHPYRHVNQVGCQRRLHWP